MNLVASLSNIRFPVQDEKACQSAIEQHLQGLGVSFSREHRLNGNDIPDFFSNGTVVEVKIKGNTKAIYKQLLRYAEHDLVREVVLVTNRSMGVPTELNGKPCYVVNMGRAWL